MLTLPIGRYVVALPLAGATFIALAVVDQRATFFAAFRAGVDPPPSRELGLAAETAVKAFDAALSRCYEEASMTALAGCELSEPLREELRQTLPRSAAAGGRSGARLVKLSVLLVEPGPAGTFTVLTDESWAPPAREGETPQASRLRFRYSLSLGTSGLRIGEMMAVLPEPARAPAP